MTDGNKEYDAIDIANYVISKSKSYGDKITNLKLQKLLYFLQAAFLVEKSKPLIKQPFERWSYGPVIADAYFFFNQFGYRQIEEPVARVDIKRIDGKMNIEKTEFDENSIDKADRKLIDEYYGQLYVFRAGQLVDLTHRQEAWKKFDENGDIAGHSAPKYTNDEIVEAFDNSENRIWKGKLDE